MKAIHVWRYLKRFSIWIFLSTLVGAIAVYAYCNANQTYTATAIIKYTNDEASSGYTPNGQPLDAEEIYCARVISAVIEDLHLNATMDSLRSRCYVEEIVPDEQKAISELLEKDGQSANFADTYKVHFVADHDQGSDYARNVLHAIIHNYCSYYTQKYIEQGILPNGTADLSGKDYDFLETAAILENTTQEMIEYLLAKKSRYSDFRASQTGYTYTDLCEIYQYLYDYELPRLYAMILSYVQTKDVELLIMRLQNEIDRYQLSIANREEQIERLHALLTNYTDHNNEMVDDNHQNQTSSSVTDYILKDVKGTDREADHKTTYDSLFQEYVELKTENESMWISLNHDRYLLEVFEQRLENPDASGSTSDELKAATEQYIDNLNTYYALVDSTSRALNDHLSVRYLQMLSMVEVSQAIDTRLYTLLAVVIFLMLGCGGAIVLGRGADFLEYLVYTDKTVGLPNRSRCDLYMEEHAKQLLPEQYSVFSISFDALQSLSAEYGRAVGDAVMKDFAAILKSLGEAYGFVGYNGAGQFLAFCPECPAAKASTILEVLDHLVLEYNQLNCCREIAYTAAFANSTEERIYDLRSLIRRAMQKFQESREEKQNAQKSGSEEEKVDSGEKE